jgi:quinol monooxygenase YgiN
MSSLSRASAATAGRPVTHVSMMEVKPGHARLVEIELRALLKRSRREPGCLLFDVYRLRETPLRLFLHEIWESREAFEAHATHPDTGRFRVAVHGYLECPIESFEVQEVA